ncbi:PhzF family phenazine biosynthesis isomerase, partial [Micrococcus sp. SIMBA_144]
FKKITQTPHLRIHNINGGTKVKPINILHYDAFNTIPDKGNPAGIVLHGDSLTDEEMQEIAFKVGFNETSFLVASDVADLGIRFFTPGNEMNLCGHGT